MTTWRVQDVMTHEVITASSGASVAELVTLLTDREITAVPVTDEFDVVLGVVSWTDLRRKIDVAGPERGSRTARWRRALTPVHWPEGTAAEIMTAPAVTIGAEAALTTAARVMYRRGVGRLLVVDGDRKLRGIVTRSDLLKVHARPDAVLRDEVLRHVLRDPLMIRPGAVQVEVDNGAVLLTGRLPHRTTTIAAARLTGTVPGVTEVVDQLSFDVDDTVAPPSALRAVPRQRLGGLRRSPARPAVATGRA